MDRLDSAISFLNSHFNQPETEEEFEKTYQKFILHCLTLPSLDFRNLLNLRIALNQGDTVIEFHFQGKDLP